jgi:glycosyltransferase involved in cell wall biosynthesis
MTDRPTSNKPRLVVATTVPVTLQAFFDGQLRFFKQNGFRVTAVSSPEPGLEEVRDRDGIDVIGVPMARRISPLADLVALVRLIRLLRKLNPHIVHTGTPKAGLLVGIAAWLLRVPVRVYTIHGLPFIIKTGLKRVILKLSERISCLCAHRVLAVGQSMRSIAVREGLCPAERIGVPAGGSANGVDTDRFNRDLHADQGAAIRRGLAIPPDAVVFGFIGRLVRDKGIIELTEAWKLLHNQVPNAHLIMVGMWEPQDPVPQEVRQSLESGPGVHLVGQTFDTPPYYAAMDVVILPTYREGFPIVPLEAAAMMLPMVITDAFGCSDAVVDGLTGIVIPSRNAPALADAMRRLAEDPDLRRRLGAAGRDRVLREFRPVVIWKALLAEYQSQLLRAGCTE